MANLFAKLVNPHFPATALGIERGFAAMVHLERGRNGAELRRAATVSLGPTLIAPSFENSNISDQTEFRAALSDLAASAGLIKQRRWSVSLPEATTRTLVVTLESAPGSQSELEEILTWKMERGFGVSLDELTFSREKLSPDTQGRPRYVVVAARTDVITEYEAVLSSLGWRTGLIIPRYLGEARWLTRNGTDDDSLLVSSSLESFTVVAFRGKQPLILRTIECEAKEREDEFYRFLLFYRDRHADEATNLSRLLVLGDGLIKESVGQVVNETLGTSLRPLDAVDLGLNLPQSDLSFDAIAAPAGLATLSW